MTTAEEPRRTALYDEHLAAGGRMVPFAGFLLPTHYTALAEEHTTVRTRAGLFDVSHMGEIVVRGSGAFDFIQQISCNDHSKLVVGRAQYTGLMYPEGTFVDDLLVHRTADDEYLLVVNAANSAKDFAHLSEIAAGNADVEILDRSDEFAQLALQGPLAREILQPLTAVALDEIKYYRFTRGEVAGHDSLIARTGYTGEDGFELYVAPDRAADIWRALIDGGRPAGLLPVGLGARDTLRLEAGMMLYGNDIDRTTTPYEAGLGWIVKLEKGDFIGRDVLERQQSEGITRRLVGFEMIDRGIARHGFPVRADDDEGPQIGHVTSGTQLPTFGKAMGMAYLPIDATAVGEEFFVDIRGRAARARVVELPFYSRKKKTKKKS
jgi:aminomethyltransferase